MRLATLNIRHGGGSRTSSILHFLAGLVSDVLVLTEFRSGSIGEYLQRGLHAQGYAFQSHSAVAPRQNSVLLASRREMTVLQAAAGPPARERYLTLARVGELTVVGAYFPQGEAKRPVFDRVRQLVARIEPLGLLLGDLNTGLPYLDESGRTFKCIDSFEALLAAGLVDAWRSRNAAAREFSWFSHRGNGFRIDHALCTTELDQRIRRVDYVQSCRLSAITDHAALLVSSDG